MIATVSFAQTSLLATLSHDGTISTFYGTTALKEALEKADNGDAITLSAGQFQAANITKAITLRGAGMSVSNDSESSHESTIITGDFEINLPEEVSERLIMEGLYFSSTIQYKGTIKNALFMKNRFFTITSDANDGVMQNCSFIHCRVGGWFRLQDNSNVNFINSIVRDPDNATRSNSNFQFENCIILFANTNIDRNIWYAGCVKDSYYKNCIIWNGDYAGSAITSRAIPSSNVAYNCLGIVHNNYTDNGYGNLFYNIANKNNTNKSVTSAIFKDGSIDYADYLTYSLTDEAKTQYLGTDAKEVGLYGGNIPYEEDPTTPQITKCNVAAKSTADGKLSVDIEVKAAQY